VRSMKRILFVDDDINVLNGLRRGLYSMRDEWSMHFTESAQTALDIMSDSKVDALVTDVRMQPMDGFELLKEARESHPAVLRVVLSGHTQQNALARSLSSAHLFLGKPCDTEMVKRRVRDILERGDRIHDETLKSLVAQMGAIPSVPVLFFDVAKLFKRDNPDIDTIAEAVSMDMGMSSAVLHFMNSGYFGPSVTSNPMRAVRWLGLDSTRTLLVRNRLCSPFDATGFEHFDLLSVWNNAMAKAKSASAIALAHSSDSVLADDSFAVGLLHDVGQIILATALGHFYDSVIERSTSTGEPLWKTEQDMIGSTHAEVGAYLLGLWGMPAPVVEAIANHHSSPSKGAEDFTALTALQIADAMGDEDTCKTRS
jgi:HD-like signal output (HDOD) protein